MYNSLGGLLSVTAEAGVYLHQLCWCGSIELWWCCDRHTKLASGSIGGEAPAFLVYIVGGSHDHTRPIVPPPSALQVSTQSNKHGTRQNDSPTSASTEDRSSSGADAPDMKCVGKELSGLSLDEAQMSSSGAWDRDDQLRTSPRRTVDQDTSMLSSSATSGTREQQQHIEYAGVSGGSGPLAPKPEQKHDHDHLRRQDSQQSLAAEDYIERPEDHGEAMAGAPEVPSQNRYNPGKSKEGSDIYRLLCSRV